MQIPVPKSDRKITVPTGLFINNEFVPSVDSQETIKYVYNRCYLRAQNDRRVALGVAILQLRILTRLTRRRSINPATEELICEVVAGTCLVCCSSP